MSLTTTPQESQFFVLDFGGGTFSPFANLPHVAGVGTRAEPDVVRRIFAEVHGIVDRREAYFRANGIDSIETYRSRRAAGPCRRRVRRRLPGRRRLGHAASGLRRPRGGDPAARDPRPDLRPARDRRRGAVGRLPGRDARPLRHPTRAAPRRPDGLRDRPQGGRTGADRAPGSRAGAGQAALPRRAAADRRGRRRRHPRRRRREPDQAGRAPRGPGPTGPKLRLLPERISLDDVRALGAESARRARRCCSGSTRRTSARSASTSRPSRTC